MVQFNLLPDIKIEYLKIRRRKRLITIVSIIASVATFSVFLFLFLFVRVQQGGHINRLTTDIDKGVKEIQSVQDLDKILTIQNQLNTLPGLYDEKVFASRLADYLNQLTPNEATISDVNVNFADNTMVIKGNSDKLSVINKYADTLKFTEYELKSSSVPEDQKKGAAFSSVVLKSFAVAVDDETKQQIISYELSFNFEPKIFKVVPDDTAEGGNPVALKATKTISTRSETEKPTSLFAPQPKTEEQKKQEERR